MTTLKSKKDQNTEIVIIGAGLSGLLTATGLKRKGYDVLLLDGADFAGGTSRGVFSPVGLVDNGLKMFARESDDALNEEHLLFLQKTLDLPIEFEAIENGPITFTHGELKPFVGFGSSAPEFHKPLSYFFAPQRYIIKYEGKELKLNDLIAHMVQYLGDSFQSRMLVTHIIHDDHGHVTSLMINGTKLLNVSNVIYCSHPKYFHVLFPNNSLAAKVKQKLSKGIYWTAVCLDLFHKTEITSRHEMHLLNGTTQDEIGPCVGLFQQAVVNPSTTENAKDTSATTYNSSPNQEENQLIQHSQWLTYVDHEAAEDAEAIGAILKKIKRQIKRVYPEAMDKLISERIAVLPCRETEVDIKLSEEGRVPTFKNLWVASGAWTEKCNLWGCVEQVKRVLSAFGTEAAETTETIDSIEAVLKPE